MNYNIVLRAKYSIPATQYDWITRYFYAAQKMEYYGIENIYWM